MFRVTIRELMLVTLVTALSVGWWLDRTTLAKSLDSTRDDAMNLAYYLDPDARHCSQTLWEMSDLRRKYDTMRFGEN